MRLLLTPLCVTGETKYIGAPLGADNVANLVGNRSEAALLSADDWGGTVYVTDIEIIPDQMYEVQADCGNSAAVVSAPAEVTSGKWGDVAGTFANGIWPEPDGIVSFQDIAAIVDGFQEAPFAPSRYLTDLFGCTPDGTIDFLDVLGGVAAFRGQTFAEASLCPSPCP